MSDAVRYVVIFNQPAVSDLPDYPFVAGQVVPVPTPLTDQVRGWIQPRPDGTSIATLYRQVVLDEAGS